MIRHIFALSRTLVLALTLGLLATLVGAPMSQATPSGSFAAVHGASNTAAAVTAKKKKPKPKKVVIVVKSAISGKVVLTGPGGFKKTITVGPKGITVTVPKPGSYTVTPAKGSKVPRKTFAAKKGTNSVTVGKKPTTPTPPTPPVPAPVPPAPPAPTTAAPQPTSAAPKPTTAAPTTTTSAAPTTTSATPTTSTAAPTTTSAAPTTTSAAPSQTPSLSDTPEPMHAALVDGRVTGSLLSEALTNVAVTVHNRAGDQVPFQDAAGARVTAVTTDSDGGYLLRLPAGIFKLRFEPIGWSSEWSEYRSRWLGDAATAATATEIVVGTEAVKEQDVTLPAKPAIGGEVTIDGGTEPAANTLVEIMNPDTHDVVSGTRTNSSGEFSAKVNPGRYLVRFADELPSFFREAAFQAEWYDDASRVADATVVTVGESGVAIDASLALRRTISGQVTHDLTGGPVRNTMVALTDESDSGSPILTSTDSDGNYEVPVPAGSYHIKFGHAMYSSADLYYPEWYDNAARLADATPVTVSDINVEHIDAELAKKPTISGRVVDDETGDPLGSVDVAATDQNTSEVSTTTASDGTYSLPVTSGQWTVHFETTGYFASPTHASEWYNDATVKEDAEAVSVHTSDVTGIDSRLRKHSAVTGVVTQSGTGVPAVDVPVYLTNLQGSAISWQATYTDGNGAYRIPAVPGTYKVRFGASPQCSSCGADWRAEWYDNART